MFLMLLWLNHYHLSLHLCMWSECVTELMSFPNHLWMFCHAASVCMMCTFVFVTLPYYSTHCVKRKTQIDKKTRTENRAQIAENYGFRIIPVGKLLLESWIINVRSATNANGRQIVSRQTTRTSIRILGTIPIRILCILVVQLFRAYSLNKNCSTGVCTPHTG